MAGIQTNKIKYIDKCLGEIGCYLILSADGPIKINHENFEPRKTLVWHSHRAPSKRDTVLSSYIRECEQTGFPQFVSSKGYCWSCGYDLVDTESMSMKSTTGCPKCHRSFCE